MEIIGYHSTNNPEDILQNGFDENKIKVAFLGKGFSFSIDSKILKNYPKNKGILKCKIVLKNPLRDYNIWKEEVEKIKSDSLSLIEISSILRSKLENLKYDGILAFKEYGWWKNNLSRDDEIIVFRSKNIKNIELHEKVTIPLEVGSQILYGKWKNKKAIVKGFSKDDKGQPVIKTDQKDLPLLGVRLTKEKQFHRFYRSELQESSKLLSYMRLS